jgi:hypothetical protein
MKQLYVIICIALCAALYGKPILKPEILSVEDQKRIDAIQTASKSNDWASVRKEYDQINWKEIKQPAKLLKSISKELKGDKGAEDLRKEIKTRYQLLRKDDDADLDDSIEPTPIPEVKFKVQKFPVVEFGQQELIVVDILSVRYADQVDISQYSNAVVVLRIKDEVFSSKMAAWENRYKKQIDFFDANGNKIVPMPGSVLWHERKTLMTALENGGNCDVLWTSYNEHLQQAVGRRINLKHTRGR